MRALLLILALVSAAAAQVNPAAIIVTDENGVVVDYGDTALGLVVAGSFHGFAWGLPVLVAEGSGLYPTVRLDPNLTATQFAADL